MDLASLMPMLTFILGLVIGAVLALLLTRGQRRDPALERELSDRQVELAEARTERTGLAREAEELRRQLDASRQAIAGREERVASLTEALGDAMADARSAHARLEELRERQAQLEARYTAAREDAEAQAAKLTELTRTSSSTNASTAELREQVAHLKAQLERKRVDEEAEAEEQSRILRALSPVQQNLARLQAKIDELEQQRQAQLGSITQQLELSRQNDEQLRATTQGLASALRSSSVRGRWGEAQLRNIVEAAGLTERVDFTVQAHRSTDDGDQRPDMVLHLPGDKQLIVDAKVPFASFIAANEIPLGVSAEQDAQHKRLIDSHVKAVRAHIDALARKAYWKADAGSPDFVIAFVPSESLLSSALDSDPALLDYAFDKRVALASPVSLWSVLRTVAYTWQQERVTEDALQLFELSKELFERVATMAEHADKLRKSVESTVRNYNAFAVSLETRVLVTARRFNRIDSTKLIPEVRETDMAPRILTASELQLDDGAEAGSEDARGADPDSSPSPAELESSPADADVKP